MGNQPMAKLKIGSVEVAVWENQGENKSVWHSLTPLEMWGLPPPLQGANSFYL